MPSSLSFKLPDEYRSLDYLSKIIILALVYYISGKLSIDVINNNFIITIGIFAAEGFSMAAVLIYGKKIWPGVFIGQLLISISEQVPLGAALWVSTINSLELFVVWYAFKKLKLNRSLESIQDVLGLFFIIIFIAQPFSAFFNTSVLYLFSITNHASYWFSLFSWWFGNTMGQLLLTPALLLLYTHYKEIHYASTLFFLALFALLVYTILFIVPIYSLPIIITITMPLIIYISIIRNVLIGDLAIVVMSVISLYAAYCHVGIFSINGTIENLINLNFFILSHILIVLIIGTLYHENIKTHIELAELNKVLENKVMEQVDKLNRQNIIMAHQARLASMGEMMGMIAHQWRQPLNSINSNVAVIQYLVKEKIPTDPLLSEKLENITTQTRFMSDTIEDFSKFFHPNKSTIHFNPETTLHRVLKIIEGEIAQIKIILPETEGISEKEMMLHSYENEYLQVILTILHNALENFKVNKIQNPMIRFDFTTTQTAVTLSIQDNGGGIRTQTIDQIFDPYFTTNHTGKNSGLGLYMAKLLIEESMAGSITVSNKEGGACFEITVPKRRDTL
jgi:signal transduction histidine kinase